MSLHFETTALASRRAISQRVKAAFAGVAIALSFMVAGGLAMGEVKVRAVPEYQPQFVMKVFEEPGGCGGIPGCQIGIPILRKPTAPAQDSHRPQVPRCSATRELLFPVADLEEEAPATDFGDEVDFGSGW